MKKLILLIGMIIILSSFVSAVFNLEFTSDLTDDSDFGFKNNPGMLGFCTPYNATSTFNMTIFTARITNLEAVSYDLYIVITNATSNEGHCNPNQIIYNGSGKTGSRIDTVDIPGAFTWINFTINDPTQINSGSFYGIGFYLTNGTGGALQINFKVSFTPQATPMDVSGLSAGTFITIAGTTQTHMMIFSGSEDITTLSIDINLSSPIDNFLDNDNTINFTYNISSEVQLDNCSLYSNFTGVWELNQTNSSPIINNSENQFTNLVLEDGTYIWNVNCNNDSFWANDNFTLTVDIFNPTITTNFINNQVLFTNLTGQFNFSDNNLIHSINITIPTNNNKIVFNRSNIGVNFFVFNLSYIMGGNIFGGNHTLQVEVSDGGTSLSIADNYDFDVSFLKGSYTYYFPEGNYIKTSIDKSSMFDKWTSIKEKNKYIQIYEPNNPRSSYSFIEESNTPIYIYNNPGHHGGTWIVTGNHWKDYVLKGEPDAKITITQLTPYKVKVNVSNIKNNPGRLEFNSVGGLNIVVINYTFFFENVTETFENALFNLVSTDLFLSFNGINHSVPPNIILEHNGTNFSATQIINTAILTRYEQTVFINVTLNETVTSANVSHRWFFNLTNPEVTPFQNQLIGLASIDNCTTFSIVAANFTTRRDDNDELVLSTLKGFFQFDLNGTTNSFPIESSEKTSHVLCIFPNDAEFVMNAQIEYNNDTFDTETYYFRNATFNNITQFFDLLFTPNSTLVKFIVKDENDDPVSDVFISILQYDFGTDTHRITEILKTDSQGEALGNIRLDTQWYKFLLNKDLKLVFESEPVKIITTTRTFRINLLSDFYESFNKFRGIIATVDYTNATRNFVYTFNNPTGNSVRACLEVEEISSTNINTFNETCLTASSGSILINLGSPTDVIDRHFIGTGFIQIDPSDSTTNFKVDQDEANFIVSFRTFGSEGIFISYLARMTVALIGIWSPVVAIIGIVTIDIGMVWMGLYHMNIFVMWSYIIMAIIVIVKVSRR